MKTLMLSCARESAGPVLAKTQYQSACTTPDIQHLVPVSTQPSRCGGVAIGRIHPALYICGIR